MAKYQCPDCGYLYDEMAGDPHEGFPPGTTWKNIPEDWACPDCAVRDKIDFVTLGRADSEPSASESDMPAARPAGQSSAGEASRKATKASRPSAKNKSDSKVRRHRQSADDWCCPDCGAAKEDYVLYKEENL